MKIFTAGDRLAQKSGPKILLVGPSGVGKTSQLRTLSKETLAQTLLVDVEAGDLAIPTWRLRACVHGYGASVATLRALSVARIRPCHRPPPIPRRTMPR